MLLSPLLSCPSEGSFSWCVNHGCVQTIWCALLWVGFLVWLVPMGEISERNGEGVWVYISLGVKNFLLGVYCREVFREGCTGVERGIIGVYIGESFYCVVDMRGLLFIFFIGLGILILVLVLVGERFYGLF